MEFLAQNILRELFKRMVNWLDFVFYCFHISTIFYFIIRKDLGKINISSYSKTEYIKFKLVRDLLESRSGRVV